MKKKSVNRISKKLKIPFVQCEPDISSKSILYKYKDRYNIYTISMRLPPCEYYTAVTVGGRQAQPSRATHATHAAGLD